MINFAKIWQILTTKYPAFLEGVGVTLELAFFTVLFGSLLGLLVAVFRRTRLFPLRWLMNAYVAFIRGTPLLVQVLLIVYGLPHHNAQVRTRNADLQAGVRPDNQTAGGVMLPAV